MTLSLQQIEIKRERGERARNFSRCESFGSWCNKMLNQVGDAYKKNTGKRLTLQKIMHHLRTLFKNILLIKMLLLIKNIYLKNYKFYFCRLPIVSPLAINSSSIGRCIQSIGGEGGGVLYLIPRSTWTHKSGPPPLVSSPSFHMYISDTGPPVLSRTWESRRVENVWKGWDFILGFLSGSGWFCIIHPSPTYL